MSLDNSLLDSLCPDCRARLRPAFEHEHWKRVQNEQAYDREVELHEETRKQLDALRASLARKDEALRACVEALKAATLFDVSPTFDARGSYTARKSNEWYGIRDRLSAALACARAGGGEVSPTKLADVLHGAYRVIGEDVPEEQRWLAVAFAAIGALESCATALAAREAETREACAKIAENDDSSAAQSIAAAIRASAP